MTSFPSLSQAGTWLAVLAFAICGASCTQVPMPKPKAQRGWWKGDGVSGSPSIVINLSRQRVNYYKGGKLVGVSLISSGREGHNTITGTYHIMEKDIDHRSSIYGAFCDNNRQIVVPDVDNSKDQAPAGTHFIGASMPYFMRITGGYGMHEGYMPGYPASHGCIRLPGEMARIFFRETPVGTPVEITGDASLAAVQTSLIPPPDAVVTSQPQPAKRAAPIPKPPQQVAKAKEKPQPNKQVAQNGPPPKQSSGWLRIGRMTDNSKPVKMPFGTTLYLEQ